MVAFRMIYLAVFQLINKDSFYKLKASGKLQMALFVVLLQKNLKKKDCLP
jgi:hypothetical protein